MRLPPSAFRFVLAATAVFGVLAFAACGDDDDDAGSDATPTSTPTLAPETASPSPATPTQQPATNTPAPGPGTLTPTPDANTDAGFRAALDTLNKELAKGTVDPLIARLKVIDYTCKPEDVEDGLGQPECDTAGEAIRGVQVSQWRSEGGLRKVESIVNNLKVLGSAFDTTRSDKYGPGTFRVYAYSTSAKMAVLTVTSTCLPQYQCTAGFQRLVWVPTFEYIDGAWKVASLMYAFALGSEFLDPSLEGRQRMPGWQEFK